MSLKRAPQWKTYLEGCNNTHAQTCEHPRHQCRFIETWAHHPCFLTQLLHKLVSGIYGGYSCAKVKSCIYHNVWRTYDSFIKIHLAFPTKSFCFHFLKKREMWLTSLFLPWESPSCLKSRFTELTQQMFRGVKIPAHAEMNVIRPKMQLSGGFAPVSLKREKTDLHFSPNITDMCW